MKKLKLSALLVATTMLTQAQNPILMSTGTTVTTSGAQSSVLTQNSGNYVGIGGASTNTTLKVTTTNYGTNAPTTGVEIINSSTVLGPTSFTPTTFKITRSGTATQPSPPGGTASFNYTDFIVDNTGNIGIGTATPANKLDVAGNANITGSVTATGMRINDVDLYLRPGTDVNHGIGYYGTGKLFATVAPNGPVVYGYGGGALGTTYGGQKIALLWNSLGYVGIGTANPSYALDVASNARISGTLRVGPTAANSTYAGYRLSVDGDVIAKRVVVQTTSWADKVFGKNYQLPTLNEVENYVNENHHLPLIPTECEVFEKGVDVGQMNTLLLQKVEELTLYVIQQQKEIDLLKAKN